MNRTLKHLASVGEAPIELYRELNPFAEQVGTPKGLAILSRILSEADFGSSSGLPALQENLDIYYAQILVPHELPAILRAYRHAKNYRARELIQADMALDRVPILEPFATVSQSVGRGQLAGLRPLRDERVVCRYLRAVDEGRARGWHTVVYGLILALYSLPLRQGLIHYGLQTLGGFVDSAGASLNLDSWQRSGVYEDLTSRLPRSVESVLSGETLGVS